MKTLIMVFLLSLSLSAKPPERTELGDIKAISEHYSHLTSKQGQIILDTSIVDNQVSAHLKLVIKKQSKVKFAQTKEGDLKVVDSTIVQSANSGKRLFVTGSSIGGEANARERVRAINSTLGMIKSSHGKVRLDKTKLSGELSAATDISMKNESKCSHATSQKGNITIIGSTVVHSANAKQGQMNVIDSKVSDARAQGIVSGKNSSFDHAGSDTMLELENCTVKYGATSPQGEVRLTNTSAGTVSAMLMVIENSQVQSTVMKSGGSLTVKGKSIPSVALISDKKGENKFSLDLREGSIAGRLYVCADAAKLPDEVGGTISHFAKAKAGINNGVQGSVIIGGRMMNADNPLQNNWQIRHLEEMLLIAPAGGKAMIERSLAKLKAECVVSEPVLPEPLIEIFGAHLTDPRDEANGAYRSYAVVKD